MSKERELLIRVLDTLHEIEETYYDLYWDIRTALEQNEQKDGYAWSTVASYEKDVGFEVSAAFKAAWDMARTRLSNESTAQPALEQEPVAWMYQSTGFRGHQVLHREKQNRAAELWVEVPLYLAPPKREPSITAREMYQRGYAAAERDLKREPLSEGELSSLYYQATNQTLREQDTSLAFGFARAIEKMHGITGETK